MGGLCAGRLQGEQQPGVEPRRPVRRGPAAQGSHQQHQQLQHDRDRSQRTGCPGALVFGTTCTELQPALGRHLAARTLLPASGSRTPLHRCRTSSYFAAVSRRCTRRCSTATSAVRNLTGYSVPTIQPEQRIRPGVCGGWRGEGVDCRHEPGPGFLGQRQRRRTVGRSATTSKPSYGRPAQVNQWNLQVQQELAKDLILTIGYIGSAGSHLKSGIENLEQLLLRSDLRAWRCILATHEPGRPTAWQIALRWLQRTACSRRCGPSRSMALSPPTAACRTWVTRATRHSIASVERRFHDGLNLAGCRTPGRRTSPTPILPCRAPTLV